jgi:hypothetical protein
MKFEKADHPESIDFTWPPDDPRTAENLKLSDRGRLDDWLERFKIRVDQRIREIYFFVHQNIELESPFLSAYFIEKLNQNLD